MKLFLDLKYFFFGFTSRTYLIIKEFKLNKSLNYVWGMKHSGLHLRKKKGKASPAYLEDGFI